MSGPEGSEKPVIQKIMHLSFEDGTPEDVMLDVTRQIASHLLIDPEVGQYSSFGTIVLFNISMTGMQNLKPREQLEGEDLRLRELTLKHFESLE